MVSALVMAANSFVGEHLCDHLRANDIAVIPTVRDRLKHPEAIVCHLEDKTEVEGVIASSKPDWIFQCAGAHRSMDVTELYDVHVKGALNVLAAVRSHSPESKVVLFGSAAEYGNINPRNFPISEDQPPGPTGIFGASKLAQTCTAQAAALEWGLRILIVRPFNILGPGLPQHYVAGRLAGRLMDAKTWGGSKGLEVINGHVTRDFVDVRDVVAALLLLEKHPAPEGGIPVVYNIAGGEEISVLALARKLGELAGGVSIVDAGSSGSPSEIQRSCGDASRLRSRTGWAPAVGWEKSLEDLWRDLKKRRLGLPQLKR